MVVIIFISMESILLNVINCVNSCNSPVMLSFEDFDRCLTVIGYVLYFVCSTVMKNKLKVGNYSREKGSLYRTSPCRNWIGWPTVPKLCHCVIVSPRLKEGKCKQLVAILKFRHWAFCFISVYNWDFVYYFTNMLLWLCCVNVYRHWDPYIEMTRRALPDAHANWTDKCVVSAYESRERRDRQHRRHQNIERRYLQ